MRFWILAVALVATGGTAAGQDVTPGDWSGFYAGIYGGYGLDREPASSGSSTTMLPPGSAGIDVPTLYTQQYELRPVETLFGGVRAGANYQVNSFVMGLEGGLTIGDFSKTASSSYSLSASDPGPPPVSITGTGSSDKSFTTNAIGTIEGRAGWSTGNWLLYGKAGLAVAQGTFTASDTVTIVGGEIVDLPDGTFPSSETTTDLLFGSSVGIGAEVLVTDNISIGAEYSLVHLPAQSVFLSSAFGTSGTEETFGDINIHTIKAGLNYHF